MLLTMVFNKNCRTQQMMAEEGGELHLEPFVHIQREEEDGEGAESHNTTTSNEDRIQVLDEGNSSVQAHPETKTGEGELSQGANVIQASKTIDEALNEIDDSYVKHQQSKENETKDQPEPTTQNETVIRENHSELNKVTQNHSDARMPSENQNPNPWVDHSHEAVNRTVSLMKEKNKKLKLEEPALDRVKREGIPIFLESKGFQQIIYNVMAILCRRAWIVGAAKNWLRIRIGRFLHPHRCNVGCIVIIRSVLDVRILCNEAAASLQLRGSWTSESCRAKKIFDVRILSS